MQVRMGRSIAPQKPERSGWGYGSSATVPRVPRPPIFLTIRWIGSWEKPVPRPGCGRDPGVRSRARGTHATELPDLNIYDATKLQTDQQIDLALRAERGRLRPIPVLTTGRGGDCDSSSGRIILANSRGFLGRYANSSFRCRCRPLRPMRR